MNGFLKQYQWIAKWGISVCLVLVLVCVIKRDYQRLRLLLPESWSLRSVFYADQKHLREMAETITVNQLMPLTTDLASMLHSPDKLNERTLRDLAVFYEKVAEYAPANADVHGLLGFCYYQLGKEEKAITAYRRSIDLNPYFFWSHYNLGLIHFKKGQYSQAANIFMYALSLGPDVSITIIAASGIYNDIRNSAQLPGGTVKSRLKKGYNDALVYLLESVSRSERGESLGVLIGERQEISLQVF